MLRISNVKLMKKMMPYMVRECVLYRQISPQTVRSDGLEVGKQCSKRCMQWTLAPVSDIYNGVYTFRYKQNITVLNAAIFPSIYSNTL